MISVANIIKQVRIDVKDINEVKYSDWDIENALNKALRLTANHFSMLNTDFMERSIAKAVSTRSSIGTTSIPLSRASGGWA